MASKSETVISLAVQRLDAALPVTLHRNASVPEKVPAGGFVTLQDGVPGDPVDVQLSPVIYTFNHVMLIDVVTQGRHKDDAFEAIKKAIDAFVEGDRNLGGACDWIEASLETIGVEPFPGAGDVKFGTIHLVATYDATSLLT